MTTPTISSFAFKFHNPTTRQVIEDTFTQEDATLMGWRVLETEADCASFLRSIAPNPISILKLEIASN